MKIALRIATFKTIRESSLPFQGELVRLSRRVFDGELSSARALVVHAKQHSLALDGVLASFSASQH